MRDLLDEGPSTFGLTDDELRRHANDLAAQGWSVDEITERLAIKPRRYAAQETTE
ncbi:hypothetical protein GCM10009854_27830 [Saccharopolyspora halophila]|uniref:Uncharacterized protein n=1 Tax=Saccharopolyspora halophila TaxID=405551 RepID=A0ABN3GCT9_9PSEU